MTRRLGDPSRRPTTRLGEWAAGDARVHPLLEAGGPSAREPDAQPSIAAQLCERSANSLRALPGNRLRVPGERAAARYRTLDEREAMAEALAIEHAAADLV